MLPTATITVSDFASPDLATALGLPPAGSSPDVIDQWAAAVAQVSELAKTYKMTGPGVVVFESKGKDGEVHLKAGKIVLAQPLETARVAQSQAARAAAARANARKVVRAVPSIAKAAMSGAVAAGAAAVVKGVSTVVGAAARPKPAAAPPMNAANRPPSGPPSPPPARR